MDVTRMTFGSRLNLLLEKGKGLVSGQPQKEKEETKRKEKPVVEPLMGEDVRALEEKFFQGVFIILDTWQVAPKMLPSHKNAFSAKD